MAPKASNIKITDEFMEKYNSFEYPRVQRIPSFYGEKLIEGVIIRDIQMYADERGYLIEAIRFDDEEMNASDIKQMICTYAYPGMVKGFHLHSYQEDHLICVSGMAKVALVDYRENSPTYMVTNEIFMGEIHPRRIYIPPGIFHGFKNVGTGVCAVLGLPNMFYDMDNVDERRVNPMKNDIAPYDWNVVFE